MPIERGHVTNDGPELAGDVLLPSRILAVQRGSADREAGGARFLRDRDPLGRINRAGHVDRLGDRRADRFDQGRDVLLAPIGEQVESMHALTRGQRLGTLRSCAGGLDGAGTWGPAP